MIALGLLAWATSLATAIVVSGVAMVLLAACVAVRFQEQEHTVAPRNEQRWAASRVVFQHGLSLSRRDQEILLVFLATVLFNAAAMVSWLYPKQLITPLWAFRATRCSGTPCSGSGPRPAGSWRCAASKPASRGSAWRAAARCYAGACWSGALGVLVVAAAPVALLGGVGVLVMTGIADSVTRAVSVVWVNRRTSSDVRATMHSFLSQAESTGEICGGLALAAVAHATSTAITLVTAGVVLVLTGVLVARARTARHDVV